MFIYYLKTFLLCNTDVNESKHDIISYITFTIAQGTESPGGNFTPRIPLSFQAYIAYKGVYNFWSHIYLKINYIPTIVLIDLKCCREALANKITNNIETSELILIEHVQEQLNNQPSNKKNSNQISSPV